MRNYIGILAVTLLVVASAFGQAAAPAPTPVFSDTTVTLNLTPLTFPGSRAASLSGIETDILWNPTPNNAIGPTTLVGSSFSFVGARYNRVIPQFGKLINELSPNINGYQLQLYLTASAGAVRSSQTPASGLWGQRAGVGVNYGINSTWGIGFEAQANHFPGGVGWAPSFVIGPNFHF